LTTSCWSAQTLRASYSLHAKEVRFISSCDSRSYCCKARHPVPGSVHATVTSAANCAGSSCSTTYQLNVLAW
jgi:hypothetical protein